MSDINTEPKPIEGEPKAKESFITEEQLREKYWLLPKGTIALWTPVFLTVLGLLGYGTWKEAQVAVAEALEGKEVKIAISDIETFRKSAEDASKQAIAYRDESKDAAEKSKTFLTQANDVPARMDKLASRLDSLPLSQDGENVVITAGPSRLVIQGKPGGAGEPNLLLVGPKKDVTGDFIWLNAQALPHNGWDYGPVR